jgi:hypothetical protein
MNIFNYFFPKKSFGSSLKMITSLISTLLFIIIFTNCQKNDIETSSHFSIKDINGKTVKILEPNLLLKIHEDLIANGRVADAEALFNLYDLKTGILKSQKDSLKSINWFPVTKIDTSAKAKQDTIYSPSSLKTEPWGGQYFYLYSHVEKMGDIGPALANNGYAGTIGRNLRLEGMWLDTDPSLVATRPTISYYLCYPDGTTSFHASWGQFTGTRGQSQAVVGLFMSTSTPGFHIYYIAYNNSSSISAWPGWGWNGWQTDGQFAGCPGQKLEAFQVQIFQY